MQRTFANYSHAADYMNSSVVRDQDGMPVFVSELRSGDSDLPENWTAVIFPLSSTRNASKRVPFQSLDLSPVTLGMVNDQSAIGQTLAIFVTRGPYRMWKVGLTRRNLRIYNVGPENYTYDSGSILNSTGLHNCIVGNYPNFTEIAAVRKKEGGNFPVAFSRNFAVDAKKQLYYKNYQTTVGQLVKDNRPKLLPRFKYLTELLTEELP